MTDSSGTHTWLQFAGRSEALGHALHERGLRPGDRVAVMMDNRGELLEAMFACFASGYCFVPLNRRLAPTEVDYYTNDSQASVLITDTEQEVHLVFADGTRLGYEEALAGSVGQNASVSVDDSAIAWLFYTSGTTGKPKGAMLTHGNLAFLVASWLADLTPIGADDVTLHVAPLSHGAGFHALAAVARGSHQIIAPPGSFSAEATIALLEEHRVTNTWMVPTQIIMLCDHLEGRPANLPDLMHIVYGGSPFAVPELERAVGCFGDRLVQLYAQGESPMTITALSGADHVLALASGDTDLLGSAGHVRPGMDVVILGEDDHVLGPDEIGEIAVRGPVVMVGYWNRPDATRDTLRNSWLHTGDMGRFDGRGLLHVVDRVKDLIITGGSNVYPAEIEGVLRELPDVRDVAVVGLTDRKWGETVAAAVVPHDGKDVDLGRLALHCESRLGGYKRPRRFLVLEELPRNAYGKVAKREVAALFDAADEPETASRAPGETASHERSIG